MKTDLRDDLAILMLTWGRRPTLLNTLESCRRGGLLDQVGEKLLFFQEATAGDREIALKYGFEPILCRRNIGIGEAWKRMAEHTAARFILLLENDWELIEEAREVAAQLVEALEWLARDDADVVRLRHRHDPGVPLCSRHLAFRELSEGEEATWFLADCIFWREHPEVAFPDKIVRRDGMYVTSSRWACYTNNPCVYRREWYLDTVGPFCVGGGIRLETNIVRWWPRQGFRIAHRKGLFRHNDTLG